jgi:hypothetical protein
MMAFRIGTRKKGCGVDEKIEQLLGGTGAQFEKVSGSAWKLRIGPERQFEATVMRIKTTLPPQRDMLKVYTPVGTLPEGADPGFFRDLFRKNRDLGHGGFALAGKDTIVFVDTLQLQNCEQAEFNATLEWLVKSVDIFKEKLDRSKLPYLEEL